MGSVIDRVKLLVDWRDDGEKDKEECDGCSEICLDGGDCLAGCVTLFSCFSRKETPRLQRRP